MAISDLPSNWKESIKRVLSYNGISALSEMDKHVLKYIISNPDKGVEDIEDYLTKLYGQPIQEPCSKGYQPPKYTRHMEAILCLGNLSRAGIVETNNDGGLPKNIKLTTWYELFKEPLLELLP